MLAKTISLVLMEWQLYSAARDLFEVYDVYKLLDEKMRNLQKTNLSNTSFDYQCKEGNRIFSSALEGSISLMK